MLKIAMIAGEASGDMLASSLISALQKQYAGEIEFVGIGGRMMSETGFKSWHNMETLSVMGYIEVIKSLPQLIKLRYQVLKELLEYKPDIFIGVDAPDFNLGLETFLTTGTTRPFGVSAAKPMLKYFFSTRLSPSSEALNSG